MGQVGDLDLARLEQEGRGVKFHSSEGLPPSVLAGSRETAYFLRWQKKVFINPHPPEDDLDALPQLELHEVLGSLGYRDDRTALSSALVILDRTERADDRDALARFYGNDLFRGRQLLARREDGGSSVGGGGDLATIDVKAKTLEYVRQARGAESLASDFFRKFPRINFEPVRHAGVNQVTLVYRYARKPRGFEEFLSVLVPMSRWTKDRAARWKLLAEISEKLLALFPTAPGGATRRFRPEACAEGTNVVFPATNDPAVAAIQDIRGRIQRRCRLDELDLAFERTAPALPAEARPKPPGFHHFHCEFRYPTMAAPYESEPNIPEGVSSSYSVAFGVDQGDYLAGVLTVARSGDLAALGIAYKSPAGEWSQASDAHVTSAGGSARMLIHGKALQFRCERR